MQGFAQVLVDSIRARIQCGQNIYDQAASPLKPRLPGAGAVIPKLQVGAWPPTLADINDVVPLPALEKKS
jgi:hypothetical protein